MSQIEAIYNAVLEGDAAGTKAGVTAALEAGLAPETILKDGLIAAMGEVGRLFEENEYFVPEMLVSARAMQGGLAILKPHLAAGGKLGQRQFRGWQGIPVGTSVDSDPGSSRKTLHLSKAVSMCVHVNQIVSVLAC